MKPKTKDALKDFFGEFGIQLAVTLFIGAIGGLGLAFVFLGWGVLWILFPFGALIYYAYQKRFSNSATERDASSQSGSRPPS